MVLVATVILGSSLDGNGVAGAPMAESPISETIVVENILKSGLENRCDVDQDRKDFCERCTRFLFDKNAGYLGCCTNYDGIYKFCDNFLNYSLEEKPVPFDSFHRG